MRIGFDAKRALRNGSGLGNYSRWVMNSLSQLFPQEEYIAFSPQENNKFTLPDHVTIVYPTTFLQKKFRSIWRTWGLSSILSSNHIDVFHGLSNELPRGLKAKKIKAVVTIHDLIFLRFPEYYPFIDRKIYDLKFRYAAEQADKIIAISEQTANDLALYYQIPKDKIEVIYQDCNELFHTPSTIIEIKNALKKFDIKNDYIVSVGTIESRKNQLNVLKAFERVADQLVGIDLVFVGKSTAYQKQLETEINKSSYKSRIKILNQVSSEEVKYLYAGSKAAVYLSVFEGFGLPVLEALNCNVPVLTSNVSSLPEAGGKAALYCNPLDIEDVALKLKLIVTDESVRSECLSHIDEHVLRFRKENTVKKIMDLYKEVLGQTK